MDPDIASSHSWKAGPGPHIVALALRLSHCSSPGSVLRAGKTSSCAGLVYSALSLSVAASQTIFSDEESADEEDDRGPGNPEARVHQGSQGTAGAGGLPPLHQPGQSHAANASAAARALARLEAGDFLESLGEELGLEVPREAPQGLPPPHAGPSRPLLGERRRPGEGGVAAGKADVRGAALAYLNTGGPGASAGRSEGDWHAGGGAPLQSVPPEKPAGVPGAHRGASGRIGVRDVSARDEEEGSSSEGGSGRGDREVRRKKGKKHKRKKRSTDGSTGVKSSRHKGSRDRDRDDKSERRKEKRRSRRGEAGDEDSDDSRRSGDDRRHKRRRDKKDGHKEKRKHKHRKGEKKSRGEGSSGDSLSTTGDD